MRDMETPDQPIATTHECITKRRRFRLGSWHERFARPAVGVDIGRSAIKAVAIDTRRQPPRITGQAIVPRPASAGSPTGAGTGRAIRSAVRKAARRPGPIACAIPANEAITRHVEAPAGLTGDALAMHLALSIEDHLHQPPEQLCYDIRPRGPVPERGSQQAVLLVATRRGVLAERQAAFRRARLRCDVVDIEDRALARTLELVGAAVKDPESAAAVEGLFDAGEGQLQFHVFSAGEPLHGQSHPVGPDGDLAAAMARAHAVYQGSHEARPIARLWLTGGASAGLPPVSPDPTLSLTPVPLDPLPALGVAARVDTAALAANMPRLASAIGLALHAGANDAHWR